MTGGRSSVLFLGGRSGVGKSSVGAEIHARLSDQKGAALPDRGTGKELF